MCKTISFLSGKGGSGKTTLALSMASMLSSCGIKVLLIDCDLSTNGATYFYEEKLSTKKNRITSFYDILFNTNNKYKFVEINSNYDFMPSVTQITKKSTKTYTFKNDSKFDAYNEICNNYDVVLFDCQAGYTDILKLILPSIDINLIVMEADAISSAAMRSLYLKIGDIVNEKKIYQVFNKASKEEYEIYSKVSGGTVFTNIETIMFDWKIRKAFSVSQIPDMENTSANYGEQIYNVCSILFPDEFINEKLNKYKTILKMHSYKEKEEAIKNQISELNNKYKEKQNKIKRSFSLLMPLVCAAALCVTFFVGIDQLHIFTEKDIFLLMPLIVSILALVLSTINIFDTTKEKRDYANEIDSYQEQLKEIITNKKNLQDDLSIIKQTQESLSNTIEKEE